MADGTTEKAAYPPPLNSPMLPPHTAKHHPAYSRAYRRSPTLSRAPYLRVFLGSPNLSATVARKMKTAIAEKSRECLGTKGKGIPARSKMRKTITTASSAETNSLFREAQCQPNRQPSSMRSHTPLLSICKALLPFSKRIVFFDSHVSSDKQIWLELSQT